MDKANNTMPPQLMLLSASVELTEDLKKEIAIVQYRVRMYNEIENPTEEDKDALNQCVDNFNFHQKYKAVKGNCTTATDIIELFVRNHNIAKIKLGRHSSNKKLCIEFETGYVPFYEFYKAHKEAFTAYNSLERKLSTLCYMIWQNFSEHEKWRSKNKMHPSYHLYHAALKSDNYKDYASNTKIRNALREIFSEFFPGFQFFGFKVQWLRFLVMQRQPIQAVMEWFIWRVVRVMHPELENEDQRRSNSPSRHVAWCAYEYKRKCTRLDIECHSSVSCPFYVATAKKTYKK